MFQSVFLACHYGEEEADTNGQLTGHICADVTHLSNRLHQASLMGNGGSFSGTKTDGA